MDQEEYDDSHQQFYLEPSIPGTLERHLKETSWTTILDVGCGDGAMLFALNQLGCLKGKTVFAIDVSPKRVKRTQSINKEFRCYVDDACELRNIPSNSIDFLVSSQVIEHVPNDDAMTRQIARVLSEGGIAYISTVFKTPNAWYFYKQNGQSVIDPTHQREYVNDQQLTGLLDSHDLSVIESIKTPIAKPIVGFHIMSRIGAPRDIFIRSALLRSLHRLKVPLPGYYIWEIVASKGKASEK
jgi:2-polyprenyl-6-hydroxyphenyl methylase/3-demethylubiquinone-9 3-methyltransferase